VTGYFTGVNSHFPAADAQGYMNDYFPNRIFSSILI
jgi:hypothetical protein